MTIWFAPETFTADERRDPRAPLHEPRRAGVRADEPAGGGEGRPVRPVLADEEVAPPTVPGRVRGGRRCDRRAHPGRRGSRGAALRARVRGVRRRLGGAARRRAPGVRAGVATAVQGARVGTPGRLPGAVDALHALRRPARRRVARDGPAGGRRHGARAAVPRVPRHRVRRVRTDVRADGGVLPGAVPQGRGRLRLRLPVHDHGEDVRHPAAAAAGRDPLQPGDLRDRPVVRTAPDASGRAPARRDARVRRADARRAPQGDPGVPEARRRRRTRARVDRVLA